MVNMRFYYRGQEKVLIVHKYYKSLKNNIEVIEQLVITLGADHVIVDYILTESGQSRYGFQPSDITKATDTSIEVYQAAAFLLGSDRSRSGKLIK